MWDMIFILGFFTLFPIVFVWRVWHRALRTRELAQRGVAVTGEVVSRYTERTGKLRTGQLRYRFTAADGMEYTHKIMTTRGEYPELVEGAPIELVYLPDKPTVSAMKEMVDIVREALEKRERRRRAEASGGD